MANDDATSSRTFLTTLLSALAAVPAPAHAHEFTSALLDEPAAPPNLKPLLLTLHALFPNELLPALDLLDRRLATRLVPQKSSALDSTERSGRPGDDERQPEAAVGGTTSKHGGAVYYVRSGAIAEADASTDPSVRRRGRPRRSDGEGLHGGGSASVGTSRYEVRLRPWNCSCPAFTFSAFGGGAGAGGFAEQDGSNDEAAPASEERLSWDAFGGLRRGPAGPLCKHLLACVLADRSALFDACVETRDVSFEELAGWAAG